MLSTHLTRDEQFILDTYRAWRQGEREREMPIYSLFRVSTVDIDTSCPGTFGNLIEHEEN